MIGLKGIYRRTQLAFESCTDMLSEGKHWPEDYKKTAFTTIKQSQLGQQSWYADDYIKQDVDTFANEFGPLSHKNSNLGFFATVIRWFVEYSGTSAQKYKEFIERKLDNIIRDLQTMLNDPKTDRESMKKLSFAEFEKKQKDIAAVLKKADADFSGKERNDYDIFFIKSYEELHSKFGGDKTGYHGQSEWCHTNGKSTYESWTSNNTKFFFVLAKKGWEKIAPPKPAFTNAYDEYGISLIAILVDKSGELLNATLRWNHVIELSKTVSGTSVDRAFLTFKSLSDAVGIDVKKRVLETLKKEKAYSKYAKIVYSEAGLRCVIVDGHFVWLDDNDNEVAVPLKISGDFACNDCKSLTSLEGAPKEVSGSFNCSYCDSLVSLKGAPKEVGGNFSCSTCTSLTSLEGAPEKVGGDFYCTYCKALTSLEGAPKEVNRSFTCSSCTSLTSLEGAPKKVSRSFDCSFCTSLTSLEGSPKEVDGGFYCYNCTSLTTLAGAPKKVDGIFSCSHCTSLASIDGAPQKVTGSFNCSATKIKASQKKAYEAWLKTQPKENYKEMKEESNMIDLKKMYEDAVMAAGAAPVSSGEIAAPGPAGDADIVKGGMATDDVLGKDCDHHKHGYLGPGCFHVPSKACKMFKREILAGKKKKKQKNDYVKGMAVLGEAELDRETILAIHKIPERKILAFIKDNYDEVGGAGSIWSIAYNLVSKTYFLKFRDANDNKFKYVSAEFDGKKFKASDDLDVYDSASMKEQFKKIMKLTGNAESADWKVWVVWGDSNAD